MKTHRKASREIRRVLADNLKALRRARGYTQAELANFSQLSKNYISNIEQRRINVTLASLEAIAHGLGCCESRLLRKAGGRPIGTEAPIQADVRVQP